MYTNLYNTLRFHEEGINCPFNEPDYDSALHIKDAP